MEKQKKKQIKRYISWILILAIVAVLAALPVIAGNEEQLSGPQASVLTAKAESRDISVAVLGGGTLITEDAVAITVPVSVKITEYLVSNGDIVAEGQPVAAVDRISVMSAIAQVQETLEHLRKELEDVSSDTESSKITATAGGTVKAVYASKGEDVRDVMVRDGALAVLSLDGLMAVRIERNTNLAGGDSVCVVFGDDTEAKGRVKSNLEGVLTVTLEDKGYAIGETVKVTTEDGDRIGTGKLYVHSPWNAVAYSGTVSKVQVSEGDTVKAGRTLFKLTDTGHTARFDYLSDQHREYEALMLELFKMYQSETVVAPAAGMITGMDASGAYMLAAGEGGWTVSLLANAPNGDDETSYINYVGQVAEVGIDGLILKMNPQPLFLTDYKVLTDVPTDPALMTESAIFAADVPVYELAEDQWIQISLADIGAGDVLLFAGDEEGNFVWVVRISRAQQPEPMPPDPSEPTEPDPTDPTDPTRPDDKPPQDINRFPSIGGGVQQETTELYSLETVTIASVTPQETVTVQITVDELDISRIFVGQAADITVDALPGRQFAGTVTAISATGENEGGNSKFTVEVTVEKDVDMLPGMRASVSVCLDTVRDVVCIPVAALIEQGTETLVYRGRDPETGEFTDPVAVATGVSDGEYVQILTGLSDGDEVYYPYFDTLVISDAPEMGGGFPFG